MPLNGSGYHHRVDSAPTAAATDAHAFLTVLGSATPLNKRFIQTAEGYDKRPGAEIVEAGAMVFAVPDTAAMARLMTEMLNRDNWVLMSGYFPGVDPGEFGVGRGEYFLVMSEARLSQSTGIPYGHADLRGWHEITYNGKRHRAIARLKANACASCWSLLDRDDDVPGMPEHLRGMSEYDWLAMMEAALPGFGEAPLIAVPSASARASYDGQIIAPGNAHYWTRFAEAGDVERAMKAALFRGFTLDPPVSFLRERRSRKDRSVIVGRVPWAIWDPTTASRERLSYDGMPTVEGARLGVLEAQARVLRDGPPIITSGWMMPEVKRVPALGGLNIETRRGADGAVEQVMIVDRGQLQLDTLIETQHHGDMTVEAYWNSDLGHIRTQAPFRDSESWNGYLNRHADGVPFAYDTGAQTKYLLPPDVVQRRQIEQEFGGIDFETGEILNANPDPEPEPAPTPDPARPGEAEPTIAEVLAGDEKVRCATSPTGSGKTRELAVRAVADIDAGVVPIVAMNSKRGTQQFEDEVMKVSGGRSWDDLGAVTYRRDGDTPDDSDDGLDDGQEARKQGGRHLCEARGVLFAFPGYSHRRGDSVEWYAFVRQLAMINLHEVDQFPEELRDCVAAFKRRRVRVYVDECDAFMASLLRVLELDRRMLKQKQRGHHKHTQRPVTKCPASTKQGKCKDCELHTGALRGRIDQFQHFQLHTAKHPEVALMPGDIEVNMGTTLATVMQPGPTVTIAQFGFTWTPLKLQFGEASLPPPKAYTRKLGHDEAHSPFEITQDLLTTAFRPTIVTHMPHTDDFLLSAEECREIDAAVEAKQARDAAERAFGGLKNAVGAGNAFGHAESPEAQAARKAAETRQADLLMLDAMRQFPSYACETRHLQLADMAPLGWMHYFADAVRFVGAAMPEWGRGMVAKAFGQESVEVVEVPSRQRLLDGLLVIDVTWELTPSQLEQLAARVIDAGERPLIFFGFAERVAGFLETHQQLSLASYEHGKTSNALTAPGLTDLPEQRGIVSYVRSAIGASANLPQFRVNIIDSIVHSPTFTLLLPEEITPEAVVEARRKARIEMLRQPAGRNLRLDAEKVTHPDGREEWVVKPGPQRRVIIFHNPERTPQPECKPLPPPPEVLAGIRERTKPGGFRFLTVRHSAPYIATAIDEFLATREVLTREPVKERKAQSKAQRRRESAEDRQRREAEKKSERRNAVLERLEEERSKGAKWTEAKRSKGVNSPIQTWFTAQERTTLKKLYNDGAALEL